MDKIVAFVDALGFKEKISSISHQEATKVITNFNKEIYELWEKQRHNPDSTINGRTFSDSLIIYTDDDSDQSLNKILIFLKELYKISIIKCNLPLRGGISIGEFDDIQAIEFRNLEKRIVVGAAFINAYSLESKIKGSKLVFKDDVNLKIKENLNEKFKTKELVKLKNGEQIYELLWGDIEFLIKDDYKGLNKFIELGCESKWIDHYFHTLNTFLTKESQREKHKIFDVILSTLSTSTKHNYTCTDDFIENFLKTEDINNLKKSFLAFLRKKINKLNIN